MNDANLASSAADRVRLLLELARLRRDGQRIWLVATARGLVLLGEDSHPCQKPGTP